MTAPTAPAPIPTGLPRADFEDTPIGWLTTVRSDGQPQASPIWFVYHDERILVVSTPTAPRVSNIDDNPHVSLSVERHDPGFLVVSIEAHAAIVEEAPASAIDAYLAKYRQRMTAMGYTPESFFDTYSLPVIATPTRWRYESD